MCKQKQAWMSGRTTWRRESSERVGSENWAEGGGKPAGAWQESSTSADSEGPESHAREAEACPEALGKLRKAC